jgi:hypothetical protein
MKSVVVKKGAQGKLSDDERIKKLVVKRIKCINKLLNQYYGKEQGI